jgi:hypothetical protein
MAKAEVVREALPIKEVVLTLSADEAQFLSDVLAMIGGAPTTRRRFANAIGRALDKVGVGYKAPFTDVSQTHQRSIWFYDEVPYNRS